MARLYRPAIPLFVKIRVASRYVTDLTRAAAPEKPLHRRLSFLLDVIARKLDCDVSDLRLDHDPPLALRPKERRGLSKKVFYTPDANDPDYLFYRPHGAQHEGSHDVKTRIRGDHGQYSDIVLIKRQRRRDRAAAAVNETVKKNRQKMRSGKSRWSNRPFPKGRGFQKRR